MRLSRMILPVVAVAVVATACSSSTTTAETQTSASPEGACSFDKTVQGVTAIQQAGSPPPQLTIGEGAEAPKELVTEDLCPGEGVAATATDVVTVNYLGVGYKTKQEFDSSYSRGEPATFPLQQVIPGWTEGVAGMKPGGVRLLLIPSELAYGANPQPGSPIQPNEALAFVVEMESVGVPTTPTPIPS